MPQVLSTFSPQMLGYEVEAWSGTAGAHSSSVWPSVNAVLFMPFEVSEPVVVTKLAWHNGGTANGNVDAGIFTLDGVKIVGVGNTAQAGTSALQEGNITDTLLPEGRYLFGLKLDGAAGTIFGPAVFGWGDEFASNGCYAAAGAAGSLAATYTLVNKVTTTAAWGNIPFVAMCFAPRTLLA